MTKCSPLILCSVILCLHLQRAEFVPKMGNIAAASDTSCTCKLLLVETHHWVWSSKSWHKYSLFSNLVAYFLLCLRPYAIYARDLCCFESGTGANYVSATFVFLCLLLLHTYAFFEEGGSFYNVCTVEILVECPG